MRKMEKLLQSLDILNCLIFQDHIVRLYSTSDQARKGAALIGETLAQKRLKLSKGKSRYVLFGSEDFKEQTRREAKETQVMTGSHNMEESPEEKYLGDHIHTHGLPASILSTIDERMGKVIGK